MPFNFQNTYARLPERFYSRQPPASVPKPQILRLNHGLAKYLGLNVATLNTAEGVAILAGNHVPDGAEPLAMAYAGHQFGNWVPQLGDGRAILLGEITAPDGAHFDIHLKGAGRTPYSRNGDGKAALGPVLREYILSEGMAALGIPTTRALAAVATGEVVMRETPLPGAVLTRVAASHIRVGTFQYFYAQQDYEALELLLGHVITRHYPAAADAEIPALAVLQTVMERQADLIARWMRIGFIHGVMNTDNMSIAGETIDYGPCAFMDAYHPAKVFSSIDRQGRYAYANQPKIAHWNLAQFAQCLLPMIPGPPDDATHQAQEVLNGFTALYQTAYLRHFGPKIGLKSPQPDDTILVETLLALMADSNVDFTSAFTALTRGLDTGDFTTLTNLCGANAALKTWLENWQKRLTAETGNPIESMQSANPIRIARNHRVEQAIHAAQNGDLAILNHLLAALKSPFEPRTDLAEFETPPEPDEVVAATFCGT